MTSPMYGTDVMIGIATGNGSGITSGNGWGRPINMSAPNGGMTHWIGSWVVILF